MGKTICIICGKEKTGLLVRIDAMISTLRWLKKKITGRVSSNVPVVCKECFLVYKKKRDSYERKTVIYAVLGIIFIAALAVISSNKIGAVSIGLIILLFLILLAQLSYMPAVIMPKEAKAQQAAHRRHRRRRPE